MAVIAVDLMSTSLTTAAISKSGKVLFRDRIKIDKSSGEKVSSLIQAQVRNTLIQIQSKPIEITSIGVSVPGIYHSKTGNVWAPNISGWDNYPLKHDLSKLLIDLSTGSKVTSVKIASKRSCDILGEKWMGAAKKTRNAIFLSIGKGIGAGVLIDGKILHGFNDGVGAVGWLALNPPFKEEYKQNGNLEYSASAIGILTQIKDILTRDDSYSGILRRKDPDDLIIPDIFEAYKHKDPAAKHVIDKCIMLWGMTAANLISMYNPEIIIFGGSLFGPAIECLDAIKNEAGKWAQPIFMDEVQFLKTQLGDDAGLFGAGYLVMKKF